MLGHEKALEEMMQLNELGVSLVVLELLRKKKLRFPELVTLYVKHLEEVEQEQSEMVSTLSMHLAVFSHGQVTPTEQRGARKLLWEYQLFRGTPMWDKLVQEFGEVKQKP